MNSRSSRQKGFTFVELIIVMVIGSLVASAVATAIYQLFLTTELNRDHMTAYRQVQHAGYWVSHDAVSAKNVTVDDDPETADFVTMAWIDWDGLSHEIIYTLVDGSDGLKELRRSYSIDGVVQQDSHVADYIDATAQNTTLSQNINSTDTTIIVASTDGFHSTGVLHIEDELIEYGNTTGSSFTDCSRGAYSTSAAAHSSGVEVRCSPNTNCYWDGNQLSMVITAHVGNQVATRIYNIEPRPLM